ncbi:MAG: phenylalanine--tRNA ligase subunit beta [bacterium]
MLFSEQWLREWVNPAIDTAELVSVMTMAGLEVDEFNPVSPGLDGIVVARIISAEPHPDADRLRVCQVDCGQEETVQIVCGAPNARAGLIAPLAQIGSVMPAGMKIKKAKLRGVLSQGMLCSEPELGLGEDSDGLMELPDDAPVGDSLYNYLSLNDNSIDVDLTPNRADCFSIRGLAREVAALTNSTLNEPEISKVPEKHDQTFPVSVTAETDCPRYMGRVIRGVNTRKQSPLWLQEKLRRCGLRSISPSVDVTNYVLMELGQPLHAFDLDKLHEGIDVRLARNEEKLTLLDGKEINMTDRMLLICDGEKPVALAGIMGGLETAVTEQTENIFLECAWFNPGSIMGRSRDLGLHTDAAHRYERGVDPDLQTVALERATQLLIDIAGGEAGPVTCFENNKLLPTRPDILLRAERLDKVVGIHIPDEDVTLILKGLGMQVNAVEGGWKVIAPSARIDIEIEEDLIEEVARVFGYNNIPAAAPNGSLVMSSQPEEQLADMVIRQIMVDRDYSEAINYSFVTEKLLQQFKLDDDCIPLANALSEDYAIMRTALIPGLVQSLNFNLNRQIDRVRLFESGVVFKKGKDGPIETERFAAVICGSSQEVKWPAVSKKVDFYDLKGDLEVVLKATAQSGWTFEAVSDVDWLHPGRSAQIMLDGKLAGYIGALHPAICKSIGLKAETYVFECDLDSIRQRVLPRFEEVPRYPSIRRDLAIIVKESVSYQEIADKMKKSGGKLLKNVWPFDIYRGDGVESGFKSVAMGLILQDVSRTLTDSDVDDVVNNIVDGLSNTFGAKLRG